MVQGCTGRTGSAPSRFCQRPSTALAALATAAALVTGAVAAAPASAQAGSDPPSGGGSLATGSGVVVGGVALGAVGSCDVGDAGDPGRVTLRFGAGDQETRVLIDGGRVKGGGVPGTTTLIVQTRMRPLPGFDFTQGFGIGGWSVSYTSSSQDEIGRVGERWKRWLFDAAVGDVGTCESLSSSHSGGCVPDGLSVLGRIPLEPQLPPCGAAGVSVSAASASEGDGSAVFTVTVTPPTTGADPAEPTPAVSVDYATVAGTASAGRDYTLATGTLTIPAGTRRATIAVPLADDGTAETAESLTLQLSNPVGARLASTSATATILDDDPGVSVPVPSVSVCDGARVSGAVGDVFDVVQSGFGQWTDVFVDVEVSCEGGRAGSAGYLVGVEVLSGPASSDWSDWCVRGGVSPVTDSLEASGGCAATVVEAMLLSTRAETTHIVRVLDSAVGGANQLRVWVDLDGDGARGRGEPAKILAADFASRVSDDGGGVVFGLLEDFEVVSLGRGDRNWRAGQWATLGLEAQVPTAEFAYDPALSRPVRVWVPLESARVGAFVYAGPSGGAEVMCLAPPVPGLVSPGYSSSCVTGLDGTLMVRYRVRAAAVTATGPQQDDLWVFWDRDRDGAYDPGAADPALREPSDSIGVPLAKAAISYVALGDSYSAGEAGEDPEAGMYLAGENPADGECRRWDQAYPVIISEQTLRRDLSISVKFNTFACTGAVTLNVFDAADPEGVGTSGGHLETNRPSPAAARKRPRPARPGASSELITPANWEPRQAVSLAGVHDMSGVDMVTLTIGGNDSEFGRELLVCALVSRCDPALSGVRLVEIEDRIVEVLDRVDAVAPDAVVFVLGYPYLTPKVDPCANPEVIRDPGRPATFELSFEGLPSGCEAMWDMYRPSVEECGSLSATGVVRGSGFYVGGTVAHVFVGSARTRIDYWEAKALWAAADDLNAAVRRAAGRAGAHFVDVVGGVPLDDAEHGFRGHSSCNTADAWMHGFVPKEGLRLDFSGADGSSFHPTAAGQRAYARILETYIRMRIDNGAPLSEAGLPLPTPQPPATSRGVDSQQPAAAKQDESGAGARSEAAPSVGLLVPRAATSVSGCGAPFVAPGEQITLAAAGFAANAAVTFTTQAASLGAAQLTAPDIPAATADGDGMLSAVWTVPDAPAVGTDPAPRAYLIDASGPNPAGGTHTALMGLALVAYPAAAPCAVADSASTTRGAAVQISVLANDISPAGGALDATSVVARDALGGSFAVDGSTGAVTFTPDAGFWGTVETTYVVYDNWGIGVEAGLTVTVASGCTITGTAGVTLIEGTAADDVICVPDRDDHRAFHIIDAKGGDDIVLGGAGVEWVYGGDGADTIWGNGGDDHIVAGAGVDTIHGGTGTDSIYSIDMADTVIDDDYEMIVSPTVTIAQSGPEPTDDWAWVDTAETTMIDVLANDHDSNEDLDPATLAITTTPTSGTATVVETSDGAAAINYTAAEAGGSDSFGYRVCDALGNCASATVSVMAGTADCTIVGTGGADTLRGTSGDDVICGLGGDDTIYGLDGNDVIVAGAGDDTVYGGDETLIGAGDGDDLIWGDQGADTLYGGNGNDRLWGGSGDDTLYGNRRDDRIVGGPGDDTAVGGGEADLIWGGPGDDDLDGHAGDDTIWGGPGADTLFGGNGDDSLWGGAGADTLTGGTGADALHGGSGDDDLDGNTQNDALRGGPGDDTLDGQGHDDQLHGGSGADVLRGGAGDDAVYGGAGDDTLDGGNGTDHLDGGTGSDTCTRGSTTSGCELPVRVR